MSSPVSGLHARLSLEHEKSKPVSFRIAAIESASGDIQKYLKSGESRLDGVLHDSGWNSVIGRSEKPLQIDFDRTSNDFVIVLQTRSDDNDTSYGHAWFRNLQVIM